MKANLDIRRKMKQLGVPVWALANVWGCHESTAFRRLRTELSPDQKRVLMQLIRQAAGKIEES